MVGLKLHLRSKFMGVQVRIKHFEIEKAVCLNFASSDRNEQRFPYRNYLRINLKY